MKRWGTRLHTVIYRLTRGRLLGHVGGQPVLLLETAGRHSGRRRETPLQYLADGDAYVVVAANGGAPRPPAWWLNLGADPRARIQVGAERLDVSAREAAGEERAALWLRLAAANRYLDRVAHKAGRTVPVVVLTVARGAQRSA